MFSDLDKYAFKMSWQARLNFRSPVLLRDMAAGRASPAKP